MMKSLIVGALQLPTLGMNATRLEFYLKNAAKRDTKLMLFGEYVLNHFFGELKSMPLSMLKEQSAKHIEILRRFSAEYDMTFVAPIIKVEKEKIYKKIVKISPRSVHYYSQQILIPYGHWNEKRFFDNEAGELREPMIFKIEGFRVAVMAGFELHFDRFWRDIMKKRVDLVLLPTASTFGSHCRWRELIKSRAFLNGCYILRANRLGEYSDGELKWRFYGDSMLVNPEGEVEMMLEDKESMLIEPIDKESLKEHRRAWQFDRELRSRGEL